MVCVSRDGNERPAKRTKYDYFESVRVLVGQEEEKFPVPKAVACHESEFFRSALNGAWKAAAKETVRLPEVDPHAFGVFVGWLHTGELDFSKTSGEDPPLECKGDISVHAYDATTDIILKCFSLGDMLQSENFCNVLVDEFMRFIEGTNWIPGVAKHKALYTTLPQTSTMRKLLVDYVAFDLAPDTFLENASEYPAEFILDVAKASIANSGPKRGIEVPENRAKCFYHDHTKTRKQRP